MSSILQRAILAAGSASGNPDLNDLDIGATAIRFWWHNNQADSLTNAQNGLGTACTVGEYVGSIASGASGSYTYRLRNHGSNTGSPVIRHADGLNIEGNGAVFISAIGSSHPDDSEKFPGSVWIHPKVSGIAAGMRFKFGSEPSGSIFPLDNPTFFAQDNSPALFCFQGVTGTKRLGVVADTGTSLQSGEEMTTFSQWNNAIVLFLPFSATQVVAKIYLNGRQIASNILTGENALTRAIFNVPNVFYADMLIQSMFFIQGNFSNHVPDLNAFLTYGIPS